MLNVKSKYSKTKRFDGDLLRLSARGGVLSLAVKFVTYLTCSGCYVSVYFNLNSVFKFVVSNRPLSQGGHFESQENEKLCFCTFSLALDERLDVQNLFVSALRDKGLFVLLYDYVSQGLGTTELTNLID